MAWMSSRTTMPSVKKFENHFWLFKHGKFVTCLKFLQDELENVTSLSRRWSLENNRIVTKFLWETVSCGKSTNQKSLLSAEEDVKCLLLQVRSVPVDCVALSLELTIVHNLLLMHSILITSPLDEIHHVLNELNITLHRVLRWLGVNTPEEKSTANIFKTVLSKCTDREDVPSASMVRLCCAWAILLLQTDDGVEAFNCLLSCKDIEQTKYEDNTTSTFEFPISLAVGLGLDEENIAVSDVVNFLCGLCLHSTPDTQHQSKQYLQNVIHAPWQQYTKYLLASLEYNAGFYLDALMILGQMEYPERVDNSLKALHCNLYGRCLSKINKPNCAVEKYKDALDLDFQSLQPLYLAALEYRELGLTDAELESLNLLVTALENRVLVSEAKKHQNVVENVLRNTQPQISLVQSLYTLANRCLELKKYEAAAQRYMDLLCCLNESGTVQMVVDKSIRLPPARKIYHEAIHSLLLSKQYDDCIVLCDRLLQSSFKDQGHFDITIESVGEETKSQGKRRMPSDPVEEIPVESCNQDVHGLLYKADALIHCGRAHEAVQYLERAMGPLGSRPFLHNTDRTQHSQATQPHQKRRRLDSDGIALPSRPEEQTSYFSNVRKLFADVYSHMGAALASNHNHREALHFLRLSMQINPDSREALYNMSLVLCSLGRENEAVSGWTKHLGVSGSDSFHISNLLQQRKQTYRSLSSSDTDCQFPEVTSDMAMDYVCEKQILQLDILCLEYLLKRRKQKW